MVISYLPKTKKIDFMELKCLKISSNDYSKLAEKAINVCLDIAEDIRKTARTNCLKKLIYSR